jgi:plastocyanin
MKKVAALLVLALTAVALVACGSDNGTTPTTSGNEPSGQAGAGGGGKSEGAGQKEGAGGGTTLKFEADPNGGLAFTTTEASAKAGNVTIDFENPQAVPHDVSIEDSSGKTLGQTETLASGSASTSVKLKSGTYTFYCSVPGHREAGMEGTLTVK